MKEKQKAKKTIILREKEEYRKKITDMVNQIENVWILCQIIKFVKNITK